MYPQIVLLGDSLIQNCFNPATPSFGPALQHAYLRRADIVDRGFGGYNTEWLLPVLEEQILPSVLNVVLWVILIGANDAQLPTGPNHVPLEKYKSNVLKIINAIEQHHKSLNSRARIILLTPPPIDERLLSQYIPEQAALRSREQTYSYAQAVTSLTLPSFVETIDLYEAIALAPAKDYIQKPTTIAPNTGGRQSRWEEGGLMMSFEDYFTDGLHLKDPSYAIMYTLVMEALARRWPEIHPENMTMPVAWWGDVFKERQQRDEL